MPRAGPFSWKGATVGAGAGVRDGAGSFSRGTKVEVVFDDG